MKVSAIWKGRFAPVFCLLFGLCSLSMGEDQTWRRVEESELPEGIWAEFDPSPFLRVSPEYARETIMFHDPKVGGEYQFLGYLFGRDQGVLYASRIKRSPELSLFFWDILESVNGGLTWRLFTRGGNKTTTYRATSEHEFNFVRDHTVVLLDIRGRLLFQTEWAPGGPNGVITAYAQDPVDPRTWYVAEEYRLFRWRDGQWEEVPGNESFQPLGISGDLRIMEVAVDSSGVLYVSLAGPEGGLPHYHRKAGPSHPFSLQDARVYPDTLGYGMEFGAPFVVSVRRVEREEGAGRLSTVLYAEYGMQRIALLDDGIPPDRTAGDGMYSGRGRLLPEQRVGYDGLAVFLDIEGRPLEGASIRAPFAVVPDTVVWIYRDRPAEGWRVEVESGVSETDAPAPGSGRGSAHRLSGTVVYQYEGDPIDPFGYRLEFRVWAEGGGTDLRVNDFLLSGEGIELEEERWRAISIPIGELYDHPPTRSRSVFVELASLVWRFRFSATGPIYLDEIRLAPLQAGEPPAEVPTAVSESAAARSLRFALGQNYPNPFNAQTAIPYQVARRGWVRLRIYDTAGRPVRLLVDQEQAAGLHQVVWDGRDKAGRRVGSGVYFFRLWTRAGAQARRLVLVR